MKVNGQFINTCGKFGWDGCFRIYIAEELADIKEMLRLGYKLYSTCELPNIFAERHPKSIMNWCRTKNYVELHEQAVFNNQINESL